MSIGRRSRQVVPESDPSHCSMRRSTKRASLARFEASSILDGHIREKELRRMDRYQQFALVAAGEAINDSGLECPPENPYRCGVVVGSGMGGLETIEDGIKGPVGERTQRRSSLDDSKGSYQFGFRPFGY